MPSLFSELSEASHIRILYRCSSDVDIFTGKPDAKLVSVNGFTSPKKFGQHVKRLGKSLFEKAREAQADLSRRERMKFLEEVGHNLSLLTKIVSPLPEGEAPGDRTGKIHGARWVFSDPEFYPEQNEQLPCLCGESLNMAAWKFAHAWRSAVEHIRETWRVLLVMTEYFPLPGDQAGRQKPLLLVRSTAPRLALVARVFFENRSFELTNKSEFCRIFCQSFGTVHKGALSPHTFKNHFDTPHPEDIDYFIQEFSALRDRTITVKSNYNC